MTLTDQEIITIAEWLGWTRVGLRPSPFGDAYPVGREPGARPPFSELVIIPNFDSDPRACMQMWEQLAKEYGAVLQWSPERNRFECCALKLLGVGIGAGASAGEAVCRCALSVIAAGKGSA